MDLIRTSEKACLLRSHGYHPNIGAISMSFFPLNLLMIPFMLPVLIFNSPQINNAVLKIQYAFMMAL
jgi:hypothetical protein